MNLDQCYSFVDAFSLDLLDGWPNLISFVLKVSNLFMFNLPEFCFGYFGARRWLLLRTGGCAGAWID